MRKRVFAMHDSFDDVDLDFDDISELPRNVKICSNCINSNVSDCTNIQNNNGENNPSSPSDVSHANYTANTTATAHDNATHTATHDTAHNQGANLMTQSTTPQTTNTEPAAIDRIPQQVEVIANTYLLSRREIDVLACLARGHNASYICKHLYIAEGTAKTHIRHIYRKLNVHSQHELMELVEQIEI
jgi:DNA-binding CsgD family transcriptional regulator